MTYPLNITGVAPWAVKTYPVDPVSVGSRVSVPDPLSIGISADPCRLPGAPVGTGAGIGIGIGAGHKSGDSSRSGGISLPVPPSFMTVMPRNEMTKGFMAGSYGRSGTTGVPPKAHSRSLPDLAHPLTSGRKKEVEGPHDIDYHDKIVSENKNENEYGNEKENENEIDGGNEMECDGYDRLLQYMEKCLPSVKVKGGAKNSAHDNEGGPGTILGHQHEEGVGHGGEGEGEGDDDGVGKDWKAAQAASTPTLLPTLRFHDLVFGHELGKGSFGCVKYARMIVRGKSRSDWPEYAVKIISNDTVTKCEYGCAVIREMAMLQMVSHPGFARLISLFRYTHSAYLVLEYAGRGDLHSMVIRRGPKRMGQSPISLPLSHLCTRFILSEVVTALLSMHSIGLSYNDLKPENILITEMGHMKITDFGGCRAFTPVAKDSLKARCKSLSYTESLRNGDWKDTPIEENKETERAPLFGNTLYDFEDDNRYEYTSYLLQIVTLLSPSPSFLLFNDTLGLNSLSSLYRALLKFDF